MLPGRTKWPSVTSSLRLSLRGVTFGGTGRPSSMLARLLFLAWLLAPCAVAEPGDLWKGLLPGPHGVGFQFQRSVDPSRNPDSMHVGTPLGLALWYPAAPSDAKTMTQIDYRLLEFSKPLDASEKRDYIDQQAAMMVAWRHIGIVPLTMDQARASFGASGRAVRDAARAEGKFPVVVILGGPWYLSTTAEFLASYGYLVVACVRFRDVRSEIPSSDFRWFVENSVRDAEWALAELRRDPAADIGNVTALGHGGGGMQALLLGMRDRQVTEVASIDAAIFSARTNPGQLIFFDPRLMRVPYLNILTSDTRRQSDQYAGFEKMKFSRRYEVILENSELRHHDLSNVGRAVSASLAIRGNSQNMVLGTFADVQAMLLQFLEANRRQESGPFTLWLQRLGSDAGYTVAVRDGIETAPALYDVLTAIEDWTPEQLREAYRRDAEAEVFSEDALLQILAAARSHDARSALGVALFATEIQPKSIQVLRLASSVAELARNGTTARDLANRCVEMEIQDGDWRAQAAHEECRERAARLNQ